MSCGHTSFQSSCSECRMMEALKKQTKVVEPTFLTKVWNFGKAAAQHIAAGLPVVSEQEYEQRMEACRTCPYKKGSDTAFSCQLCGCNMQIKGSWAEQRCPYPGASRWPVKRMTWASGLTTVPNRREMLSKTLASLENGGFSPIVFVDGEDDGSYKEIKKKVFRGELARPYLNFWLGLQEIYARNPTADRYIMFQDDILCVAHLAEYLDACQWPSKGYLNLYTYAQNEAKDGKVGWHRTRGRQGMGALGLAFTSECVKHLLTSRHMIEKFVPKAEPWKSWKNIDGGVSEALRAAGFGEYTHSPSLLQHVGLVSSCGNEGREQSSSFPGEQFDARQWL